MTCKPLISGALWNLGHSNFVSEDYNYQLPHDSWMRQFDQMQDIGLDLMFFFQGVNKCMARSSSAGPDLLEFLLSECDKRQMQAIIEVGGNSTWSVDFDPLRELHMLDMSIAMIHERYGRHDSFSGWYLPYEIHMPRGWLKNIGELYRGAVELCKAKTPCLPVVVSPFFMPDTTGKGMDFTYYEPEEYVDAWSETLRYAKIDILCLQDNGGQHLSCFTDKDTEPFIEAYATACRNAGTRLWGNVETGELPVADLDDFVLRYGAKGNVNDPRFSKDWRAVPINRLVRKLELMSNYAERNLSWGYREFMRSDRAAYEAYYEYFRKTLPIQ
ncbi:MAG: DUF4434 domain-containing protein [Victivallales bacterium]|jgi:hypothetical protein